MCGIVGIFAYHPGAPRVDPRELERICNHMAARGPDGEGTWISQDGRVGLAHRRLAVLDLSDASAQPMSNDASTAVITFNGEIYNFRELRAGLEARGHDFRSEGDAEVLLRLYERDGEAMVDSLRGMFAFAIWDAKRCGVFIARDPFGIKPLYYADDGETLRFASQVKALLAGGAISSERDSAGAAGFLLTGSVPEPFTFYRGISSVKAGESLFVDSDGSRRKRYYSLAGSLRRAREGCCEGLGLGATVREALRDSIRAHCVSDVPVGVFLSAGIDSGAIVGLMSETGHASINAVTLDFSEFHGTAAAEAPLAGRVARRYGVHHHLFEVSYESFASDLPRILESMDQPSIDGVNVWLVSQAARRAGLKVCLSGIGADELFGGYASFAQLPTWVRRLSPLRLGAFASALARTASWLHLPLHSKAMGLIAFGGTYPGAWFAKRGLFMPWELAKILGAETARAGLEKLNLFEAIGDTVEPPSETPFGSVMLMESSLYMRNQLLRDADWAGMAHSLEIRVPFVDRVLFERVAAPLAATEGSKKFLIADSLADPLPDAVLHRAKSGFGVPIGAWYERSGLAGAMGSPGRSREHWSRRWARTVLSHTVQ